MSVPITLRALRKLYGNTPAVNGIDLEIPAGSLFFLLGPSGCGKTTLLRMLAGFVEPTSGSIHFGDRDVTALSANHRNTGMVFQGYALWPHMSVRQNVAFGLNVRKVPRDLRDARVEAALKTVQMLDYAERKPNELSGGQQQRVALARALVVEPSVLLLDEPLSNLDAKLRTEMRGQIKRICKQANITTVYVTHDQKEALSMADAMVVLDKGRIVQRGTPRELYDRPENRFVASFLGETNLLPASVIGMTGDVVELESPAGKMHSRMTPEHLPRTGNVTCSVRPEAVKILHGGGPRPGANCFTGTPLESTYQGETAQHLFDVGGDVHLKVFELHPRPLEVRAAGVRLTFDPRDVVILSD